MTKTKTFEDKMSRLEDILSLMTDGIPLTESVKLFKEGMSLVESLEKELAKAEETVKLLVAKKDGYELVGYDEE